MRTRHPRVGVGVLVLRGGRVLLGERLGSHGAGTWAPPGGHLDFGETIAQCATREVLEETGLNVTAVQEGPYVNTVFADEGLHYLTVFAIAECADGMPSVCEPEKCVRWEWFTWDALPAPLFKPVQELHATGFSPRHAAATRSARAPRSASPRQAPSFDLAER